MTYEQAVAYLESFENYERVHEPEAMREVKLERMGELCRQLGHPQRRFRSIVVTGTNGKGSVCAMLYSMLRESRLRVGLYVSPHVEHLRERIRVWTSPDRGGRRAHGDDWISEEAFVAIVEQLRPTLEALRAQRAAITPTYFEVLTAIAFVYFQQQHVEVGILEVGLGGRLDATNVVEQAVSILTPIDLDHADVLGDRPETIAREKAGIIKPRQTVISAPQSPEVMAVLQEACDAQAVPLVRCGEDLTVRIETHTLEGLRISVTGIRGIYESLSLPLIGRHQAQNAALAIAALEALSNTGIPHTVVARGLSQVIWPGRMEFVHEQPLVMMDGAHNPQAARALVETLTELCPGKPIHFLVGMSADKSVEEFGELIGSLAISATCTKSRHPRALDPTVLAKRLAASCPDVHVMSDAADAYTYVLNAISPQDIMVVTGSLFLVGELRAAIRQSHVRRRRVALATA